jgi:BirA family biotin operon repressor/biotin-[acetyl-CoA-carboxylase] ligase
MSVVLHVDERTPLAPLAAAVAVCHAFPQANGIKWPNDVWVHGRKLAGILIEGRPQEGWAVLGIGLNVATAADEFPPDLRETATSLRASGAPAPATPREALHELLPALDAWLTAPADAVLGEWSERDALRGKRVRWGDGQGVAAGVDEEGSLLVETDAGVQALHAGEVHLLRD